MKENKQVVAVVGDFKFLFKYFSNFFLNLTNKGNYKGEIVILTSLITPTFLINSIRKNKNISVVRFPNIKFTRKIKKRYLNLDTNNQPNRFETKNFQWFKLNLFHAKMRKWEHVLYLDINLTVHHDINKIMELKPLNIFYAKADAYPEYNRVLESQFDTSQPEINDLRKKYNLSSNNYFQSGLIYYDTSIIKDNTLKEIVNLSHRYPISITNEQGILNLYFQKKVDTYIELPEYLDDYIIYFYWKIANKKIIITKQLVEQYK